MQRRTLLSVLPAAMLLAQVATATTIGVPADFSTVQAAVDAASPGDVVLVGPGTYVENVTINKNIALLSSGGRSVTTLEGIAGVGALGAVLVTGNTTGMQLGDTGQGFKIVGIDNGNPGIENAAVYFQGPHSNAIIVDNEIVANGDEGLLTEYGAAVTGFQISDNEFSGTTFVGTPAGDGFATQYSTPNVPRQLVVMGCGGGCATTSGITFTGNLISGTAGGINASLNEQGNTLVTIDATGAVITGNTFAGATTRFGTSLRSRGPATTISGNNFSSTGLTATTGHVFLQNIGTSAQGVALANTFDKGVYVDGPVSTIGVSVQAAVLASPAGTTIDVLPGTYTEQVIVDGKDLTLRGSGKTTTFLRSPATLATTFTTPTAYKPVVTAANTGNVVIEDFTIDGDGQGNANNRFLGVAFWEAGGALLDCDVVRVRDTPASGAQHGVGIYAFNLSGGPFALEVGNCSVTDYQKNAMALSGVGLTVDVHDCTTVGAGDIAYTAQNGIQVSYGASGLVRDCVVSNMRYTPASTVASGILLYQGTNVDLSNVALVDVQESVYYIDTAGSADGVSVSFVSSAPDYDGFAVSNSTVAARVADAHAVAAPMAESSPARAGLRAAITVNLSNGCLTGTGGSGTVGVSASSSSSALNVNVSNMSVTNWDYGLVAYDAPVSMDVVDSKIAGNLTAGYENTGSGSAQSATSNWWGAADGPSGDGAGSGNAVLSAGGEVDFDPWRTSGASSTTCAFTPMANEVTPNPPGGCISTITPCVTVPIDITRTDTAGMRGFSVTFTLSPELKLCAGLGSIAQGTYLSSLPGSVTHFEVLSNGGGSYTADGTILGLPCGQTAPTGTLFTVGVADSTGVPGTGMITVTDVIVRDCANQPIAATPGAAALITVDGMPPAPMSNLAAVQVKSGNTIGSDTTGITVTFTAPVDAVVTEVWAAPYGNYPEYDDAPGAGSVPAAPGSYPPGSPWQLTSVTASGQAAHPADRDFWYFVVYSKDACGNVSPVSNRTDGTLNYHLGDVSDGVTLGHGDNMVDIADMSLLGAHYGVTLIPGDTFNYLDVGPTTNFSVDALPQTDNKVNFEDLMMFAINFGQVTRTPGTPTEAIFEDPRLAMSVETTGDRVLARLLLDDHTDLVQGVHAQVRYDASSLELVGTSRGALAESQTFLGTVSELDGVSVDVARLGHGATFHGNGEVAVLEFRRVAGSSLPSLADATLRDSRNHPAARRPAEPATEDGSQVALSAPVLTSVQLVGARPNPFSSSTDILFRIPAPSVVTVQIHDVTGRHVRTLVEGSLAAGEHVARWDGRTDAGFKVGSGIYFYTFRAGNVHETRKILVAR